MTEAVGYEVRILKGRRRGDVARVVGSMPSAEGRRLTCKFKDGTYEMILEQNTERVKAGD